MEQFLNNLYWKYHRCYQICQEYDLPSVIRDFPAPLKRYVRRGLVHKMMMEELDIELDAIARPSYGSSALRDHLRSIYVCRCNENIPILDPRPAAQYAIRYQQVLDLSMAPEEIDNLNAASCPVCFCTQPEVFMALPRANNNNNNH